MVRKFLVSLFVLATVSVGAASAQSCSSYPNTLTNGQPADASQVMANFNFILNCLSNVAGANANVFRNRIINPSGQINQAGVGSRTNATYDFDQWLTLTQSAAVTVSQQTNLENGTPFAMRSANGGTSQRFGRIQWIESGNVVDFRGQTVVVSARVQMSSAQTLRYAIVEWTGAADTITKDVVNDWNSTTYTTGNFFKSTSLTICGSGSTALTAFTLASISLSCTVSGSMNNLAVFFWTNSAQGSGITLDVSKVQLEIGSTPTPLAFRDINTELNLCLRYLWIIGPEVAPAAIATGGAFGSAEALFVLQFPQRMRTVPQFAVSNISHFVATDGNGSNKTWSTVTQVHPTTTAAAIDVFVAGVLTAGQFSYFKCVDPACFIKFDARL